MTRRRAAALALALALGCGDDAPRAPVEATPSTAAPTVAPAPAPEPAPADPSSLATPPLLGLEALEDGSLLDLPVGVGSGPSVVVTPEGPSAFGCAATTAPTRVLDGAGRMAIVRAGTGYLVAGYVQTTSGEAVAIARLNDDRPASIFATLAVDPPVRAGARRAPPALAVAEDGRLLVAATNADGALLFGDLELGSTATADRLLPIVPAAHVDARFAPAIVPTAGATAVAWTDGSQTPMRVRIVRVDRTGALLGEPLDVTPEAGGAAAPTAGRGSETPTLFFVDPRVSISVVSRVTLAADATPSVTEVVRPLARAADPASFVVLGQGASMRIAYVAVGSSGSRAVGLLAADGSEPPVAVVAGLGFGEPINVDGAALGTGAVLAAEAPSAAAPDAPHEVRVRALGSDGRLAESLVLGGATDPAIAAGAGGEVAVATSGGYVTRIRCRVE